MIFVQMTINVKWKNIYSQLQVISCTIFLSCYLKVPALGVQMDTLKSEKMLSDGDKYVRSNHVQSIGNSHLGEQNATFIVTKCFYGSTAVKKINNLCNSKTDDLPSRMTILAVIIP